MKKLSIRSKLGRAIQVTRSKKFRSWVKLGMALVAVAKAVHELTNSEED